MELFEVGKPFKEGITRYPEGVTFDINCDGCDLLIYTAEVSEKARQAITKGDFKYGYFKEENVIIMLFRFGNHQWIEVPYSIHMCIDPAKLKEVTETNGFPLNIYIINATTGVLEDHRFVELDTRLSKLLREDVLEQKNLPYDGFNSNLKELNSKFSTKALVSMSRVLI
jgi:hypothetical protein